MVCARQAKGTRKFSHFSRFRIFPPNLYFPHFHPGKKKELNNCEFCGGGFFGFLELQLWFHPMCVTLAETTILIFQGCPPLHCSHDFRFDRENEGFKFDREHAPPSPLLKQYSARRRLEARDFLSGNLQSRGKEEGEGDEEVLDGFSSSAQGEILVYCREEGRGRRRKGKRRRRLFSPNIPG